MYVRFQRVIVGLLIVAACSGCTNSATKAIRGDDNQIVSAGELPVSSLIDGDCFTATDLSSGVAMVQAVRCENEHTHQIYHTFTPASAAEDTTTPSFPGAEAVTAEWKKTCGEKFTSFVGTSFDVSLFTYLALFSGAETWDPKEPESQKVRCVVTTEDGSTRTSSAQDTNK